MMVIAPGIGPLLADGAMLGAGLVLGHAVMRLVAGPSGKDHLARTR